jgi:hypothetical protein
MPSGAASTSFANWRTLLRVAFVRMAARMCDVPVLYSIDVPGSLTMGLSSA